MSFSYLIAQNAYHNKEFVLVMYHFLRHGTTGLINPSPGLFIYFFFFYARPDKEGQATSPLESLFHFPQLSVSRKFKSIAQQNTPCRLY